MRPRRITNLALLALALSAAATVPGACTSSRSPYLDSGEVSRDPQRARELHAKASRVLHDDPAEAEKLLREALAADLYHGPSHNNLGILLLDQGQLYEAASEFEWARKLMPGHPDPRVNLALTLESAGQFDRALDTFTAALEVYENYLPAVQGRTRLQIATGQTDETTISALEQIALRGDEQWRDWAALWMTKLAED